mgnify:FL=1|jgi:hypothetical protein
MVGGRHHQLRQLVFSILQSQSRKSREVFEALPFSTCRHQKKKMPKSFSTSLLLLLSVFIFITSCIAEQRKLNENVHDTSSHCDEDGNSTSTLSTDHKSLFPMNGYDVGSTILVFVGSSFANAGGAGGGGIFVPLLILLAQFSPHGAIPLSKAMSTYLKHQSIAPHFVCHLFKIITTNKYSIWRSLDICQYYIS